MKRDFWLGAGAGVAASIFTVITLLMLDADQVTLRYTNTGETALTDLVIEGRKLGSLAPRQTIETRFSVGDAFHTISFIEGGKRVDGGIDQFGGSSIISLESEGGGYSCPKPLEYLLGDF